VLVMTGTVVVLVAVIVVVSVLCQFALRVGEEWISRPATAATVIVVTVLVNL
jgi:hypothetical protein